LGRQQLEPGDVEARQISKRLKAPLTIGRAAMIRIALIALAIAAFADATATTAGAMNINMSAPRFSGGIAGGSHAFTPRPFNRIPNVSIPFREGSLVKHAKAASKDFCEVLFQCCIKSGGAAASCCRAYNNDKFCPY
jgi:hypothetical protein